MAKNWTIERIKQEVQSLDPSLKEEDDAFKTATVMLAGLVVGPNINAVAKFTNLPRVFVRLRAAALRANGIWKAGQTHAAWFGKNGGMAFWMDVNVAEGLMKRMEK